MKKLITKLALASALFTGAFNLTGFVNANADQATTNKSTNQSVNQLNRQMNQYMNLLKQSPKTGLIKELIKDGQPSSLSDLGSKIALHSDNQAASSSQDAKNNAAFYLKVHRIFNKQINQSYQCDDGNKLSTNLKGLKNIKTFNNQSNIQKVSMTGMGLGDSMDFGNRPNNN